MANHVKMNQYISDYTPKDYGVESPAGDVKLDCSLGVNPHPPANRVVAWLRDGGREAPIKSYPHDDAVKDALADWFRKNGVGTEHNWLTKDNFILGNGSFDILCNMNLLCLTGGKAVYGHAPQFTAYVDHVRCTGSRYEAYVLDKNRNYRFDATGYLAGASGDHALFIVENPNNPTGQVLPLEDVERIASRAHALNTILIVDEAYGDYMPFRNSAVNLIPHYPNIIVTKSLSKGFGLAGMRFGYAVAAAPERDANRHNILTQLQKPLRPFNCNGIARGLAKATLDAVLLGDISPDNPNATVLYDPFRLAALTEQKRNVISAIQTLSASCGRGLQVAETCESTPIMALYATDADENFNLHRHLMKVGLSTVSCASYIGLDQRAVRLMLPRFDSTPLLLELLEKSIRTLPAPA